MLATAARYWHTVRHLRPVQVGGRLWFRLARPSPDLRAAPPLRAAATHWVACARAPRMTGASRFRFLGEEREIAAPSDWNHPDWPRLWLYNAHYFDDLACADAPARADWHAALVAHWLQANPPGRGTGWEPYPLSLRLVNWCKWMLGGGAPTPAMRESLAVQARWLGRRLEVHLLGNHLWANAKALVFAGAVFDGDEAAGWRVRGLRLLRRELAEQVLADGGHFERSPMYHAILLEDVLDLLQLDRLFPGLLPAADAAAWRDAARRMLHWLARMTHPDGEIAFFNDAAFDIAPRFDALAAHAARLGVPAPDAPGPVEALPDSGYVRLSRGDAVLIVDVAPLGPDYLPGHAHADTLSFELSLRGRRVLANGGTGTYERGPARERQRGTAMHNTVEVDGADSSETWASFRVARRARPLGLRWGEDAGGVWVEGAHDGYRRLPGRVLHRRRWDLGTDTLRVRDELEGRFARAVARFRCGPGVVATAVPGTSGGRLVAGDVAVAWRAEGAADAGIVRGEWHPRFGEPASCAVVELGLRPGKPLLTTFEWS